jgi:hypothetical protein
MPCSRESTVVRLSRKFAILQSRPVLPCLVCPREQSVAFGQGGLPRELKTAPLHGR